jgi:hypothetical protein
MFTGASASPVRLLRLLSALIPVTLPLTAGRLSLCRPNQAKKEIKKSFFLRQAERGFHVAIMRSVEDGTILAHNNGGE